MNERNTQTESGVTDFQFHARRLRLVAVRCAMLLDRPQQAELLKQKSLQWFASRLHLTVGEVIEAAATPRPMERMRKRSLTDEH
jgi:hypothetical protein